MTFQIGLLLACGLSLTLASISHTSVYRPYQTKYSYGVEHGPQRYWPVRPSPPQWHRGRGIGFANTGKVGPSALGIEPEIDFGRVQSYSTVSRRERNGAWSRVDVRIGHSQSHSQSHSHVPTSYSLYNLYSTRK